MVVAIDGPAGSGKSTLARLLAGRLGFRFLDSGAMYRSLTLKALRLGVDPADGRAMTRLLGGTEIRLVDGSGPDGGGPGGGGKDGEGRQRAHLDGEDVSAPVRGPEVTAAVSVVAAHAGVREGMVARQRAFVEDGPAASPGGGRDGVVVEGRDIGTVVFPDAAVKFYLDASPGERARRRAAQAGTPAAQEIDDLRRRDAQDEGRAVAPLRAAEDATRVDTTGRTVEEVLETLAAVVRERLEGADGR